MDPVVKTGEVYRFVYVAYNALGDSVYSNELIAGMSALPTSPSTPLKDVS